MKIWLTSKRLPVDPPAGAIVLVAKGFEGIAPTPTHDLEGLLTDRDPLQREGEMWIYGLTGLISPSTRVRVGQILLRPRPGLRKVVIDRHPFVVEPWRVFWMCQATEIPWDPFVDSFRAESRWRDAFAHGTPDPFSVEQILAHIQPHTSACNPAKLAKLEVEVTPVSASFRSRYAEEKAAAFEEETSLAAILRRLSAIADQAVPGRRLPTTASLFKGKRQKTVVSDLPVDAFLVERLTETIRIHNEVVDACT